MTTATHSKTESHIHENWHTQSDAVTHNDVIEAYLKGKEVGRDEAQKARQKLFEENLLKAQTHSEELFATLNSMGVNIQTMHLRADNITEFMTLLIADSEVYVSDKILEAIRKGRELKQQLESPEFSINFYFTYHAETLNENCLEADGYFLKYNGNIKRKLRTRGA